MKMPKTVMRYCPHCKKHQEHVVERKKTSGRAKAGLKKRDRHRRERIDKGYGGSPYPLIANGVRYGAKTSQKVFLRFKCKVCSKINQMKNPFRAKKFEIAAL